MAWLCPGEQQYRFLLNQITEGHRNKATINCLISERDEKEIRRVWSTFPSLHNFQNCFVYLFNKFSSDNNIDDDDEDDVGEKKWTKKDEGKKMRKMPVKANKRKLFTSLKNWNFYEKSRKSKQKKKGRREGRKKQVLGSKTNHIHLEIFFFDRSFSFFSLHFESQLVLPTSHKETTRFSRSCLATMMLKKRARRKSCYEPCFLMLLINNLLHLSAARRLRPSRTSRFDSFPASSTI